MVVIIYYILIDNDIIKFNRFFSFLKKLIKLKLITYGGKSVTIIDLNRKYFLLSKRRKKKLLKYINKIIDENNTYSKEYLSDNFKVINNKIIDSFICSLVTSIVCNLSTNQLCLTDISGDYIELVKNAAIFIKDLTVKTSNFDLYLQLQNKLYEENGISISLQKCDKSNLDLSVMMKKIKSYKLYNKYSSVELMYITDYNSDKRITDCIKRFYVVQY